MAVRPDWQGGAAVVLVLGVALASGPYAQQADGVRVAGRVVDGVSGEPIASARVTAYRNDTEMAGSATADADGAFEFAGLPAGRYRLSVFHDTYAPSADFRSTAPPVLHDVRSGQPLTDVVLRLPRRPVLTGTVLDEAGEPIVNVEVAALRLVSGGGVAESDRTGRTDDRGMYRLVLSGLADEYLVQVRGSSAVPLRPGQERLDAASSYPTLYFPAAVRQSDAMPVAVGLNAERHGVDFALSPLRGFTVAGQLVEGQGASGLIDVALLPTDGSVVRWDAPAGTVRVPPGVRFSFPRVPPGRYLLWAVSFPRRTTGPTVSVRRTGVSGFTTLGSVLGPAARPVGPAPDGETLWVRQFVTVENADLDVTARLAPGSPVSGRVVFDGEGPAPAAETIASTAVLVFSTEGVELGSVPVGGLEADGRFRTVALPPGSYEFLMFLGSPWHLRSVTLGGRDVTSRPIELGAEGIRDLVFSYTDRRSTVSGSVRDLSGRAVAGASVAVFPTDRTYWSPRLFHAPIHGGQSREDGGFEIIVRGGREYFVAAGPRALGLRLHDAGVLETLSRAATIVRVDDGQQTTVDVTVALEPSRLPERRQRRRGRRGLVASAFSGLRGVGRT